MTFYKDVPEFCELLDSFDDEPFSEHLWDAIPLVFLRIFCDADSWKQLVHEAEQNEQNKESAPWLAVDALLQEVADAHPHLDFLPHLTYQTSNLTGAELLQIITRVDRLAESVTNPDFLLSLYQSIYARTPSARPESTTPACLEALLEKLLAQEPLQAPLTVYSPSVGAGALLYRACKVLGASRCFGQDEEFQNEIFVRLLFAAGRGAIDIQGTNALIHDAFEGQQADFVVALPPLNARYWRDVTQAVATTDKRWFLGTPPPAKANFAWVQQALYHLKPEGRAYLVVTNDVLGTNIEVEKAMRDALVREGRVRAVIALPGRLLANSPLPLSILVIGPLCPQAQARVLFVDAQEWGVEDASNDAGLAQRTLPPKAIEDIAGVYTAFLAGEPGGAVLAKDGFARVVAFDELEQKGLTLLPSQYLPDAEGLPASENKELREFEDSFADIYAEYLAVKQQGEDLDQQVAILLQGVLHENR